MSRSVTPRRLVGRALPGFVGWTVALCLFLLLFGVESVLTAAATLTTPVAMPLVVLGVVATVCWGVGLWRTLRGVGAVVHPIRAVGLFFAATFVNGVTPFGQTGGDPVSAILVERTTGVAYESGLAALVSVTGINRLVSAVVVGVAGAVLVATGSPLDVDFLPGVPSPHLVVAGVAVVVVGLVGVRARGGGLLTGDRVVVSERGDWVARLRLRLAGVADRLRQFATQLTHTLTDRRTVGVVVCCSVLGELALGSTLWGTLQLLGVGVPVTLALVAVPLSRVGAVVPTPGGAGGVEVALAGLLVAVGSVPAPVAGVAALAFRLLTFAVPTVVGGGVVALVLTDE